MLKREAYQDRESWLAGRGNSIGASEAAAVVGLSPFETAYELWQRKTGRTRDKDLSGSSAVEYGNRLEPAMRTMFQAEHPELTLEYHQFDVLYREERPWMSATLDGELTDAEGRKYVLEIKTAQVGKKTQYDKWRDAIPTNYLCQCCHQLLVTGWEGVYLYAKLVKLNGDSELKTYLITAEEHKGDMEWLMKEEAMFWESNVKAGVPPKTILPGL